MLHNRYYTGVVTYNGVEYRGDHEPLIDEATFERVQALLNARNLNKDKAHQRPHHLKGNLFCAMCGRRLGIVVPKNRFGTSYPYFYCLGRQTDKASCTQGYMPVGLVERSVRDYWTRVRIPTQRMQAMRQVLLEDFAAKHVNDEAEIARQRTRIAQLEKARKKNKDAYYADVIELDEFKADQERIRREIAGAERAIAKLGVEVVSLTRSLDDALSLLDDPQGLYDQTPEGLKTLLVMTVFEKIWIMAGDVVGAELTEPFAELLTLEARMALVAAQAQNEPQTDEQPDAGETYGRTRHAVPASLRALEADWSGLHVERPRGSLPVDSKNPRPRKVAGSNLHHLVGLTGFEPATP
jgi:site-specific DNA recombinase